MGAKVSETVIVAMSGGVDSSLAVGLLKEQGYDVVGVHMRLSSYEDGADDGLSVSAGGVGMLNKQCCSIDAANDARAVCARLGVPFYVLNFENEFQASVIDYFTAEYEAGRTPNPCLACNRYLKFHFLMRKAMALGADYLATGHYARIRRDEATAETMLLKANDPAKDQSYALYMLDQATLAHTLLPIGEHPKTRVRELAAQMGLLTANKPESMDICFIPSGDYRNFIKKHGSGNPDNFIPGPILDVAGTLVGQHNGLPFYTIGQRKGLGLATGAPLYVVDMDTESNTLVVGPQDALLKDDLTAGEVSYTIASPPTQPFRAAIKVRYRAPEVAATVTPLADARAYVSFDVPQRAITPGQAVVFYDGDRVLGGGTIL